LLKSQNIELKLLLVLTLFWLPKAGASIDEYRYPFKNFSYSNYGTLGLIQNPNARLLKQGSMGFTWTHNEPYLRGSIVAYPFSWMEVSYQYVDINNDLYSKVSAFSGSQSLKDKSFDAKFKLLKESANLPQIALGFRDLAGTGVFSAEYLAASKFIKNNIDLTIGIGWGNLNSQSINNPLTVFSDRFEERTASLGVGGKVNLDDFLSGPAGFFAGVEYYIPNFHGAKIKLEYDGTNYETEGRKSLSQKSNFNFGIEFPSSRNFSYKFNYVKGDTFSFGFSYKLDLGKKNAQTKSKIKQRPIDNSDIIKVVTSRSDSNLYKASLNYLSKEGFFLQKASINDNELEVVFSQSSFRHPVIAAGRAISILDQISPSSIEEFKVSEINGGIGLYSMKIDRDSFIRNKLFNFPESMSQNAEVNGFNYNESDYKYNPVAKYPAFFHTIGPDIRSQIGGPDGFFFGDLKIKSNSELLISRNISLISVVSYGIYDNMDDLKLPSNSVLPHVRTDIVDYLKESRNFSIERLQLNKFGQFSPSIYYKVSGGILESMFNGVGGEVLYKPFDKNYGAGIEVWEVFQREYNQMFEIRDYSTVTGHISLYYTEPKSNVTFRMKGGRFLAKDSGVSFDFWRVFDSGFRLGAFFSLTDISYAEFGEGSFDKGFYFHVPIEIFSQKYSKRNFGWGLRPLTRDGAAALIHSHPLWGIVDSAHKSHFNRHSSYFYD
jgi:hypothetical protein